MFKRTVTQLTSALIPVDFGILFSLVHVLAPFPALQESDFPNDLVVRYDVVFLQAQICCRLPSTYNAILA